MENLQRGRSASESRSSARFSSRPSSRHPSREGSRDRTRASSRERRIAEMKPVQFDQFEGERFESTKRYDQDSSDDSNWDAVLSKNNG